MRQRQGHWMSAVFGVIYYMTTTGIFEQNPRTSGLSGGAPLTPDARARPSDVRAVLDLLDQLLVATETEFTDRDLVRLALARVNIDHRQPVSSEFIELRA